MRQPLRGAVHRGAEPGRAGADDRQVEHASSSVDDHAERAGDARGCSGRPAPSGPAPRRPGAPRRRRPRRRSPDRSASRAGAPRSARRAARGRRGSRRPARPPRSPTTCTASTVGGGGPRPVAELLGDRAVELLVARAGRLGEDRVDLAQRRPPSTPPPAARAGGPSRPAGRAWRSAPSPRDRGQHARRRRRRRKVDVGEHHGHRVAGDEQLVEPRHRVVAACDHLDPVLACVAAQLGEHRRPRVLVTDGQHEHGHHRSRVYSRRSGASGVTRCALDAASANRSIGYDVVPLPPRTRRIVPSAVPLELVALAGRGVPGCVGDPERVAVDHLQATTGPRSDRPASGRGGTAGRRARRCRTRPRGWRSGRRSAGGRRRPAGPASPRRSRRWTAPAASVCAGPSMQLVSTLTANAIHGVEQRVGDVAGEAAAVARAGGACRSRSRRSRARSAAPPRCPRPSTRCAAPAASSRR